MYVCIFFTLVNEDAIVDEMFRYEICGEQETCVLWRTADLRDGVEFQLTLDRCHAEEDRYGRSLIHCTYYDGCRLGIAFTQGCRGIVYAMFTVGNMR